jgi:hypothetical protein
MAGKYNYEDEDVMLDGDDPFADVKRTDDGTAVYSDGDDIVVDLTGRGPYDDDGEESDHDENLAEKLDADERRKVGEDLVLAVKADDESREKWKRRLREGLELIGVEDIPTDSSAFDGSSTVNHPAIAEAMVRFQANAIEEVFPAEGPVKCVVIGESNPELQDQAVRVQDFMNYQLTEADDEYFEQSDQLTMYLPYAGSAFRKVYYDHTEEVSVSRFVDAQHFIVPYDATSLKTSKRYTHWYTLSDVEVDARKRSGEFLKDAKLDPDGKLGGRGEDSLSDVSDDREESRAEDDVTYDFYEVHVEMCFEQFDQEEGEDIAYPYVVTVELESGEIMAIRRLWKDGDRRRRKRVHFIHYKFLPGLGFYGWGYLHIIGSLGKAASGALRALLDGSATASLQGGFKSKESKVAGEFVFKPGVWQDVDMTAEDLAKSFYTPPFKEPSPALFHTLDLLVNGIKTFASTTEAMTGAADNKGPVGTTLALIEQGSKIYSGIHKRMHNSARREFKLLAALNYECMEEEAYPYDVSGGDRSVFKSDFDGRVDILPVSDPNIYSSVQRIAQAQAVLELITQDASMYDEEAKRIAHLEMYKALRIPKPERFLPKKRTKRMDPVTENQIILTGGGTESYPEQDHEAHIHVHQMFLMEVQGMGLDPKAVEAVTFSMQAHLVSHHAHAYRLRIEQQIGVPLPDTDFTAIRDEEDVPVEIDNAVARAVAANVAPPPPPQGPEPDPLEMKQQEHEQRLAHKDEEHKQKLSHKQSEHDLDISSDEESHDQALRKKAADNIIDSAARVDKMSSE